MMFKRIIYLVIVPALLISASCGESNTKEVNKDRLSTDLVNNPRSAAGTDTAALNALATMDFRDTLFDFGMINQGQVIRHEFEFTNNGKSPLVISNAAGSCGCTVADYPREPMEPGKTGVIKVQFHSAGKRGHQEKSITLTTNSISGSHHLYIKGEVKE